MYLAMKICHSMMLASTVSHITWEMKDYKITINVTGTDLSHLKQLWQANPLDCWLNDKVINGYILLICNAAKQMKVS